MNKNVTVITSQIIKCNYLKSFESAMVKQFAGLKWRCLVAKFWSIAMLEDMLWPFWTCILKLGWTINSPL